MEVGQVDSIIDRDCRQIRPDLHELHAADYRALLLRYDDLVTEVHRNEVEGSRRGTANLERGGTGRHYDFFACTASNDGSGNANSAVYTGSLVSFLRSTLKFLSQQYCHIC